MTHCTFTIKLQHKYVKLFMLYTRMFNMNWRLPQEEFQREFDNVKWNWGPSDMLTFSFASPVYGRVCNLLAYFVILTRAKILLHDHTDNPYEPDPEPYLIVVKNNSKIRAAIIVGKEIFLYKRDHIKTAIRKRKQRKVKQVRPVSVTNNSELPF